MTFAISRTAPFRALQASIGVSTYRLNTIFVGLDCVAKGIGDGGTIAVTWSKPSAKDAPSVAHQARSFACAASLAFSFDVVDAFLRAFANEEWLEFDPQTVRIATKADTPKGGAEYSIADRLQALLKDLELKDKLAVATAELFSRWRNAVVHQADRSNRLSHESKAALLNAKSHFYEKYSHIDIELALKNFESKNVPVAKEVTTLIAIMVNGCRLLDEAAIRRAAPDSKAMDRIAETLLRASFGSGTRGTDSWKHLAASWHGSDTNKLKLLKRVLPSVGLTPTTKPVSPALSESFCTDLASLNFGELAKRFEIHCG